MILNSALRFHALMVLGHVNVTDVILMFFMCVCVFFVVFLPRGEKFTVEQRECT